MGDLFICSVDTRYIDYLRAEPRLRNVYDNKDTGAGHGRKYLGVVLYIKEFNYYIPLSSPKTGDYETVKGVVQIKKSVLPIIRITSLDKNGQIELKGTLRISHMIPVPQSMIIPYVIENEADLNYKTLIEKEYEFIKANTSLIYTNARVIYYQKKYEKTYYSEPEKRPRYLDIVIDFKTAEEKCVEYK
jgi:protein AbiQ